MKRTKKWLLLISCMIIAALLLSSVAFASPDQRGLSLLVRSIVMVAVFQPFYGFWVRMQRERIEFAGCAV